MTCLFVSDTTGFSSLLLPYKNILACSRVRGLVKKRWTLAIARTTEKKVTFPLKARKIAIGCVGKRLSNEILFSECSPETLSVQKPKRKCLKYLNTN